MTKSVIYTYLGTNGILNTPIHLEGIYSTSKIFLVADKGCKLTRDNKEFFDRVQVQEEEIKDWKEVGGQN